MAEIMPITLPAPNTVNVILSLRRTDPMLLPELRNVSRKATLAMQGKNTKRGMDLMKKTMIAATAALLMTAPAAFAQSGANPNAPQMNSTGTGVTQPGKNSRGTAVDVPERSGSKMAPSATGSQTGNNSSSMGGSNAASGTTGMGGANSAQGRTSGGGGGAGGGN